jgi:Cytochrome P460
MIMSSANYATNVVRHNVQFKQKGDGAMPIHKNAGRLISFAGLRRVTFLALAAICITTWSLSLWAKPNDAVPYPAGYRLWAHVKTALIGPQSPAFENSGGIHHIYANEKATEGYRTGKFPDGSVMVADFLETRENAGVTTEGPRRRIDVMVKDGRRYTATGGWGFEQFKGDSQTDRMVTAEIATKCFDCHSKQKERDSVFSEFRK